MSRNFIFQMVPQRFIESVQIHLQTNQININTVNSFEETSPTHTENKREDGATNKSSQKRKRDIIKLRKLKVTWLYLKNIEFQDVV